MGVPLQMTVIAVSTVKKNGSPGQLKKACTKKICTAVNNQLTQTSQACKVFNLATIAQTLPASTSRISSLSLLKSDMYT